MDSETLVTDIYLLTVLQAITEARNQSLATVDQLDQQGNADLTDEEQSNLLRQQKQLSARLAILRGLNKKAILNVRKTKQQTSEARQEIDALHLQLQNLYYKQSHLQQEITACEQFQHKYKNLSMMPPEDYLQAHQEAASLDDHELTIARIEDEYRARQALEEERQALMKRKAASAKITNDKKEQLVKLDAEIEKWIGQEASIRKIFDARAAVAAEI